VLGVCAAVAGSIAGACGIVSQEIPLADPSRFTYVAGLKPQYAVRGIAVPYRRY
jgi:hypothetical protein